MSGRHMNARPKRLTRKQKEALSAQGWDSRLYLCVRDAPDYVKPGFVKAVDAAKDADRMPSALPGGTKAQIGG